MAADCEAPQAAQAIANLESRLRHDMLQPVAALRMLLHRAATGRPATEARMFDAMATAVDELEAAVARIALYERLAHGATPPKIQEVGGDWLAAWLRKADASGEDVSIEVRGEPESAFRYRTDPALLTLALDEGLANALDFGGGRPAASEAAALRHGSEGREIRIRISDAGPGPVDGLDVLARPFHAPAVAGAQRFARLGLGLAIAKLAAESAGAALDLRDGVDGGAVFELRAPILAS